MWSAEVGFLLAAVSFVLGDAMVSVKDLHPVVIVEYFNFLADELIRNAVVMLVLGQTDVGVFHYSGDLDLHQLGRQGGKGCRHYRSSCSNCSGHLSSPRRDRSL